MRFLDFDLSFCTFCACEESFFLVQDSGDCDSDEVHFTVALAYLVW